MIQHKKERTCLDCKYCDISLLAVNCKYYGRDLDDKTKAQTCEEYEKCLK